MIENQELVQKKISTLIEKMYPDAFPLEFDQEGVAHKSHFLRELECNGLCVGWVKLYMQRPQWLRSIWELVSAISQETFDNVDFEEMENLFRNYKFSNGSKNMMFCDNCCNEVISSAIMAWNYMGDKQNYPKWPICPIPKFDIVANENADINIVRKERESFTLTTDKKNAESIFNYIKNEIKRKNVKELMFHIDTMIHHMCVHSENYGKYIYMVETEKFGIGSVANLSVIEGKLSKDLYQKGDCYSVIDTIDVTKYVVI